MKINNVNNTTTTFKALVYSPNSKIYTSTYLTTRDKEMLKQATERLKNTRFWDLEVTGAGLRIASKFNKDAFLDEFNIWKPESYLMTVNTIYDGHAEGCQKGKSCSFNLNYGGWGRALDSYEKFINSSAIDRAVYLTEQLEDRTINNKFSLDPDGTITNPKNFFQKLFNL